MGQAGSAVQHTTESFGGRGRTNTLPPILFHQVHGENIRISGDGTVARRERSFCEGATFSNRPINVEEKLFFKLLEVSNEWCSVLSFGFTYYDPNNLRYGLPEIACTDLRDKRGYWVRPLQNKFAQRGVVIFYYVTGSGDVHFGINGEEKGVFLSGVKTRGPLWAIIDVCGKSIAIELVDPRQQLNNTRRNLLIGGDTIPGDPADMERHILPSLAALTINQQNHHQPLTQRSATDDATTNDMPGSRFQQPGNVFSPLPFHTTHGRNIRLSNDLCIASRADTESCNGYVFTARPIQLGERVVIKVLATKPTYLGPLAFGLTSCDPATIQEADLPDDSDFLLDRPDYWVVSNEVAYFPQQGDELSFCVKYNGEVQFSKNGSTPVVLMHVDQTIQLWAFIDVYGGTEKVRILGSCVEPHHPHNTSCLRNSSPPQRGTNLPCILTNQCPTLAETTQQCVDATAATGGSGTECTICCERPIDSLLYKCGHMCMCYECAIHQWRGMGGGHCPLCRAVIRDVVRAYKS